MRQEFFTASRGDGAQLEGKKIRVSTPAHPGRLADRHRLSVSHAGDHIDDYLAMLKAIMTTAAGVRRPGAASLDLAYVAAGRIDGFWEFGLSPWDTAAGRCSFKKRAAASARPPGPNTRSDPNIVAGNPKVYQGLLEAIGPLTPGGSARLRRRDRAA